jgi:glycosidase
MPYPWGKEDNNLIRFYRKIGAIRRNNDIYRDGDFELLALEKRLLIFARKKCDEAFVTVVNNSNMSLRLEFSRDAFALITESPETSSGHVFTIPAYTAEIYKTQNKSYIKF